MHKAKGWQCGYCRSIEHDVNKSGDKYDIYTYHRSAIFIGVVRHDVNRSAGSSGFIGNNSLAWQAAKWIQSLREYVKDSLSAAPALVLVPRIPSGTCSEPQPTYIFTYFFKSTSHCIPSLNNCNFYSNIHGHLDLHPDSLTKIIRLLLWAKKLKPPATRDCLFVCLVGV